MKAAARRRVIRSRDLGIALHRGTESELFKWFLACLLFGKPIQQEVARRAYLELARENLVTPEAILRAGWDRLVEVLDQGRADAAVRGGVERGGPAPAPAGLQGRGTDDDAHLRPRRPTVLPTKPPLLTVDEKQAPPCRTAQGLPCAVVLDPSSGSLTSGSSAADRNRPSPCGDERNLPAGSPSRPSVDGRRTADRQTS